MVKAVVFGCGNYYKKKSKTIKKIYEIVAFIDNAVPVDKQNREYENLRVYNPQKIAEMPYVKVILCSVRIWQMYSQLKRLGIEDDRIVFVTDMEPLYDHQEEMFVKNSIRLLAKKDGICFICDKEQEMCKNEDEFNAYIRKLYTRCDEWIMYLGKLPIVPISRRFGGERGTPIDRYYIDKMISDNKECITGDVMEIGDALYTKRFGVDVNNSYVLHVNGWGKDVIKGNLATGEGIQENLVDCLICTQTIQFIYDVGSTIKNVYRLLKPGGIALVTASGIAQLSMYDYRNWGEYWKFTRKSLELLFGSCFIMDNIEIQAYGNVKTAMGFLYGLTVEDLDESDLNFNDEQYTVTYGVIARK